ncbi:MAG: phytanoyl-CoA dioxygenase family protein [Acidimicrobiia bacterium]
MHEAIAVLMDENRSRPDARTEELLVRLRHEGFGALDRSIPADLAPAVKSRPGPPAPLAELPRENLTAAALREGFARNGCVLVRQLVAPERVAELRAGIDAALTALDAGLAGAPVADTTPWYAPFTPVDGDYRVGGRRNWVRNGGAMWTADSPRMLFALFDLIDELGVGKLVTDYLGERPVLSANKCTLRRTEPGGNCGDWHQDGAFLGPRVRSVNFWLSLEHAGRDAPGLDIVPRRLDRVLATGTGGAHFDWAVGSETVADAAGDVGVARPEFGPGDALFFDHLFLHRTAVSPEMRQSRHALETWFFAPSTYPDGQIPLVY